MSVLGIENLMFINIKTCITSRKCFNNIMEKNVASQLDGHSLLKKLFRYIVSNFQLKIALTSILTFQKIPESLMHPYIF